MLESLPTTAKTIPHPLGNRSGWLHISYCQHMSSTKPAQSAASCPSSCGFGCLSWLGENMFHQPVPEGCCCSTSNKRCGIAQLCQELLQSLAMGCFPITNATSTMKQKICIILHVSSCVFFPFHRYHGCTESPWSSIWMLTLSHSLCVRV